MNQVTKQTYRIDLILQGIVYFPMILFDVLGFVESGFFILGALLQFCVGVIQVLSGAFHSIRYQDDTHKRYFMGAIGYLAFLFLGGTAMNMMGGPEILIIPFLFIVPIGIATWYYRLTWMAYKEAPEEIGETRPSYGNFQEDILDDILL